MVLINFIVIVTGVIACLCVRIDCKSNSNKMAKEIETRLKGTVDSVVRQILPHLIRSSSDVQLSPECTGSILALITGLRNLDTWAFSMLDASGKLPAGIMEGTAMSLGSYDQCLEIGAPGSKVKSPQTVVGQYCSVEIKPLPPKVSNGTAEDDEEDSSSNETKQNEDSSGSSSLFADPILLKKARFRIGICLPSLCSENDMNQVVDQGSKSLSMHLQLIRCETKQPVVLDNVNYTTFGIFAAVILLVLCCTAMDICHRDDPKPVGLAGQTVSVISRFFRTFSFVACTERFLNYRAIDPDISALNGIRFISVLWNILGNIYFLPYVLEYTQFTRRIGLTEFEGNFSYGVISNFMLSYEAPFFVSAVVVTYCSLKRIRTSSKVRTLFRAIGEDFLRLLFISSTTTLISLAFSGLGSGPLWGDIIVPSNHICRRNWWRNILLISNLLDIKEMCIIHNWIVYSMAQIQIVALLVLLLVIFKRKLGVFFNFVYLFGSILCTAGITAWFEFPPALDGVTRDYGGKATDFINYVEIRPYTHISVYAIGVFVGILIVEYKDIKISKVIQLVGWILSAGLIVTSVYSLVDYRRGGKLNSVSIISYAALHRPAFILAIGWITFVCARSKKGLLKRILGWRVFGILDQLTMFVYCLHPMMILSQIGAVKERTFLDHDHMITNFFGMTCRAYLIGFVLHILIEQPIMTLHRWVWSRSTLDDHLAARKQHPRLCSRGISLKNIMILEPHGLAAGTHKSSES